MGKELIVEGKDAIAGRLATFVAREALHGNRVIIVDAEKVVISGKKRMLVQAWKRRYEMGAPKKGPYIHRQPDRLLRRIIRGMLPMTTTRGRDAFKRVMCHIGKPDEFKNAKPHDEADCRKLPRQRFLTLAQLSKELGGEWNE